MTQSLPRTKSKRNLQIMLEPYFYLAPGMLLILLVTLVPLLIGISYSFQHMVVYDTFNTGFVGLENYSLIFGDALFWNALWNTLRWTVVSLIFQVSLGLGLALFIACAISWAGAVSSAGFFTLGSACIFKWFNLEVVVRPENGTTFAVVVATWHHSRTLKHIG